MPLVDVDDPSERVSCRKKRFRSSSPRYRLSSAVFVKTLRLLLRSLFMNKKRYGGFPYSLLSHFLNKSTLFFTSLRLIRKERKTRTHTQEKCVLLVCTARCVSVYTLRERERMFVACVKCEEISILLPQNTFLVATNSSGFYVSGTTFSSSSVHHNSQFFFFLVLSGVVFRAIFAQNEIALFFCSFLHLNFFNHFSRQT